MQVRENCVTVQLGESPPRKTSDARAALLLKKNHYETLNCICIASAMLYFAIKMFRTDKSIKPLSLTMDKGKINKTIKHIKGVRHFSLNCQD